MDFDFIDNSSVNEAERSIVIKKFIDFVDNALANISSGKTENDIMTINTKRIEVQQGELRKVIQKRTMIDKQNGSKSSDYEIDFTVAHIADGTTTFYSETYHYDESGYFSDFVERTTGNMVVGSENSKHTTEKHEVGNEELTKAIQFISDILVKE